MSKYVLRLKDRYNSSCLMTGLFTTVQSYNSLKKATYDLSLKVTAALVENSKKCPLNMLESLNDPMIYLMIAVSHFMAIIKQS